MGTEQYVQHDWSSLTWAFMQIGMVLFVVAVMGLFLVMVSRAARATTSQEDAVIREAIGSEEPAPQLDVPHAPAA